MYSQMPYHVRDMFILKLTCVIYSNNIRGMFTKTYNKIDSLLNITP